VNDWDIGYKGKAKQLANVFSNKNRGETGSNPIFLHFHIYEQFEIAFTCFGGNVLHKDFCCYQLCMTYRFHQTLFNTDKLTYLRTIKNPSQLNASFDEYKPHICMCLYQSCYG